MLSCGPGWTRRGGRRSPMPLLPHHDAMLRASALTDAVIAARGYRSVEQKTELAALGFGRVQQRTPGLLLPIHGPSGEVVLHQFRPDEPRRKRGTIIKYETPTGSAMRLDIPLMTRARLQDVT